MADRDAHREESVFPYGALIGPVIGGVILIMVGLSAIFGWEIWDYLWPIIVIVIGIAIIVGSVMRARKRY